MRLFFVFNLVFFLLFSNITFASEKINKILPAFEKSIQKALQDWGAPGVAVAIVKDGQVIYQKGFGVTEVGKEQFVNEHTVFPIASLSKNFLATLFARLVSEGKISFDDPVLKHLPDFSLSDSSLTTQFTIRDLLSHRSGLRNFSGDSLWYLGATPEEIRVFLSKLPVVGTFRKTYGYQNHMFGIASIIAEKITGEPIKELYEKHFFKPLDMKESSVGLKGINPGTSESLWQKVRGLFSKKPLKNAALPHHIINGKVTVLPLSPHMYTFPGSTGVNSSVSDMAKWMLFHLANSEHIISAEKELRIPHVEATDLKPDDPQFPSKYIQDVKYGMGWFIYNFNTGHQKVQMLSHMGGFAGVRSVMVLVPSENLGIVILSNFGAMRISMLPEALRGGFFDLYFDLPETDWTRDSLKRMQHIREKNKQNKITYRLQNPRAPKPLEKYTGEFENELYGKLKVVVKDKQLWLHYRDKIIPLQHWNGDEFSFEGNNLTPVYSSYDEGYIEFGSEKSTNKLDVCVVNLLFEGKDDLFRRIG